MFLPYSSSAGSSFDHGAACDPPIGIGLSVSRSSGSTRRGRDESMSVSAQSAYIAKSGFSYFFFNIMIYALLNYFFTADDIHTAWESTEVKHAINL